MTNATANQVIGNTDVEYEVKLTIVGDGSGEATAVLVNATTGDMGTTNRLVGLKAICTGCTAVLYWKASSNVVITGLPQDKDVSWCLDDQFRGIPNNAGAGKTGDVVITTTGLGAGDTVTVIMTVRKVP